MNRELMEYFSSLNSLKSKKDGLIHTDSVDIELLSPHSREQKVPLYTVNGIPTYIKPNNAINSAAGMATSKMYRDIGFVTPTQYYLTTAPSHRKIFSRVKANDPRFTDISTATLDISSISGIEADTIDNILSQQDKESVPFRLGSYAWQFLYDNDVKAIMLEYMTPETYNEIIGEALVAEARTDIDRHFQNGFLYKKPNEKKYSGFIPIDLDNLQVIKHILYNRFKEDNFEEFINSTYESTSLTGRHCHRAYRYRVADLREIIEDGVVPYASVQKLKSALEYDLPREMAESARAKDFSKQRGAITSAYSMLWDYNRRELGSTLGL